MLTLFNSNPSGVQAHSGRTTRPLSAGREAASRTSFVFLSRLMFDSRLSGDERVLSAYKPLGFYAAEGNTECFFGGNPLSKLSKNLKSTTLEQFIRKIVLSQLFSVKMG